jgi:ABC-2 type transport system ATP-binding protein
MDIIKPDSGYILFQGRHFHRDDYKRIGYLPEERGLYQKARLRETMIYFGQLKGLSAKESMKRTDKYLERFDLVNYANRKVEELSKGNQQKVQFIISIMHDPVLLILDEPFSGLDPINQLLLKEIIGDLHRGGCTIIFSMHEMEQVEKLCGQICMIDKGKKVLYGNLHDIKKEYGTQQVKIEFRGNKEKLRGIKLLKNIKLNESSLTGEIPLNSLLNDILKEIMDCVSVTHFQLLESSLEQIFIEQVQKGRGQ